MTRVCTPPGTSCGGRGDVVLAVQTGDDAMLQEAGDGHAAQQAVLRLRRDAFFCERAEVRGAMSCSYAPRPLSRAAARAPSCSPPAPRPARQCGCSGALLSCSPPFRLTLSVLSPVLLSSSPVRRACVTMAGVHGCAQPCGGRRRGVPDAVRGGRAAACGRGAARVHGACRLSLCSHGAAASMGWRKGGGLRRGSRPPPPPPPPPRGPRPEGCGCDSCGDINIRCLLLTALRLSRGAFLDGASRRVLLQ